MYLKGVEINGFKSFSNKVNLEFNKGLTAIVGPNGSGKSNILDAVLWVLGEQSYKSIRAKEGKDVIFSGGKNKKARNTATVSLYIDNTDKYIDYDSKEIIITRSINRVGENIYSLNGKKTRLKDINNLLMDTGIGKQAYSVIGQGKIERIISSSSQELRNIIDEAAGVKKAKIEKETALKKLENVENEVEKIEYVENDLEKNVIELEKQAKLARQYREYTKKINILKHDVYSFYISKNNSEIENLNDKSVKVEFLISDLENKIENYSKNIIKNKEKNSTLEKKLDEILNSNNENTEKLNLLNEQYVEYVSKKANFESQVNLNQDKIIKIKENKTELEQNIVEYKQEKSKINNLINLNKNSINELENIISKRQKEKEETLQKIKKSEELQKKYEVDKLKLEMTIQDSIKRVSIAKVKLEQINDEKKIALEKLSKINFEKINDSDYEKTVLNLKKLKEKFSDFNIEKNKIQQEYEFLDAKCEVLSNILKNSKLMNNAIQFIQNNSKNDKDVYGPLVNLIEIDEKYHLAISTIAGYSLNDIVVKNSDVARKYVELLKKNKIGSASFLPIENLVNRTLNNASYNYARNIVKNKSGVSKIDSVINHVFGNTVIVNDLKEGIELSKKFKDRIVSLNGDLISSTGRITGGYITKKIDDTLKNKSSLQNLIKQKEILKNNLDEKNLKLKELQNKISKLNIEFENKKEIYETKNHELNTIKREIATYEYEFNENNTFIINEEKEIQLSKESILNIEKNILKNSKMQINFKKVLDSVSNDNDEIETISKFKIDLAVQNEKYSNINKQLNEKMNIYEKVKKDYDSIKEFLEKKQDNYNLIENKIKDIKNSIKQIQNNDILAKEEINKLTKETALISDEYKNLVEEKSKFEITKNKYENEHENIILTLKRVKTELNKYQEQFNKLDIYGKEEYTEIIDEFNVKFFERKIALNEKSRQDLGEVNLSAIREYEEKNKRYEELKNEKFDLLRAKESVLKLIEDIDKDIIEKFSDATSKIQENFSYMCKELLHGAKGTLKIQDDTNLIDTGIELNVKYKNKLEQSLSLLSGGEKSMLAVAFIISIFMYKPSPFTFFDEVEAALDEQNTIKLVNLLKKFSYSQFIMITHNKETMKGADRLYGVTMNKEVGESLIVSVDI